MCNNLFLKKITKARIHDKHKLKKEEKPKIIKKSILRGVGEEEHELKPHKLFFQCIMFLVFIKNSFFIINFSFRWLFFTTIYYHVIILCKKLISLREISLNLFKFSTFFISFSSSLISRNFDAILWFKLEGEESLKNLVAWQFLRDFLHWIFLMKSVEIFRLFPPSHTHLWYCFCSSKATFFIFMDILCINDNH